MPPPVPPIRCAALTKRYADVVAVAGLDLTVNVRECFGLLGPNGAGKTTTIEILEGYRDRTAGEVEVLGVDPQHAGRAWRERLGVVLQSSSLYPNLTVHESLRTFGGYYSHSRDVGEVIEIVGLTEKANARVRTLSGGQKRRLDLGLAWDVIGRFRAAGGTVLLTTHYMEEAERLCDRVAIMDHGKVIALGTPRSLIASLGAEHVVEFALADGATRAPSPSELAALPGVRAVRPGVDRTALTVAEVHRAVPALLGLLERRGAELSLLATHHATLEDVFVSLTGRQLRDA
ncbi:MAG: ABC transporter ATP-binding protein [Gemmatimonadetes bacterium]|nr:MAG: ABC transporter ATP-binding protein [Gemmatimonadota bacterium]